MFIRVFSNNTAKDRYKKTQQTIHIQNNYRTLIH